MFWILAVLVGLVVSGLKLVFRDEEEILTAVGGTIVGLFGAILLATALSGIGMYASLLSSQEEAISIGSEIETMRSAHYSSVSGGTLVGGSLDNMQQSQALSNYIRMYVKTKTHYNRALVGAKIRKTMPIYRWFTDGIFISKRVLELKKI